MNQTLIHNSSTTSKGNIWLFWHMSLSAPNVISYTRQAITVHVGEVLVIGVHAACFTMDRRNLWEYLICISELNLPWFVICDFNAVLSCEEEKGGRNPLRLSMQDFRDCVESCNPLQDPKSGIQYSWCNNRVRKKRVMCDLDMVFCNLKWMELYDGWCYKVGVRGTSDHGPLLGGVVNISKPKKHSR